MKKNAAGDAAMTCVSLYMVILRADAVNTKYVTWAVDVCYVGLIDTNHNVKKNRYQMIGGSCAAIIGVDLCDIGLLQAAVVTR